MNKANNTGEYPGKEYQELFDYSFNQFGMSLLQSEMDEIISIVHKHHPQSLSTETGQQGVEDDSGVEEENK